MKKAFRKRVFVIYGRDVEAYAELAKFLHALNLEEIRFEEVAGTLGPSPFVADIVLRGIKDAHAVIALFTPDEHAALYDPASGSPLEPNSGGSRWQARPNVIFEAGIAYGRGTTEPILVVLGADVSLFSDVGGRHFVHLGRPDGKRNLFKRLDAILGPIKPRITDWESSPEAGNFARCERRRWRWFDEVHELERYFDNQRVGRSQNSKSLLQIVQAVVEAEPNRDWTRVRPADFMTAVRSRFTEAVTDDAYWWFIVHGFFRFDNIVEWGVVKGATWEDSCDEACLTERGAALIERVKALRKDG
jgi:hypothetical protein